MDGLGVFLLGVDPGLHDFQHEQAVFLDQASIDDFAFQVGEAFRHQRRPDLLRRQRRQAEGREFIHVAARHVADRHHRFRQFHGRHGDDAFLRFAQRREAVIAVAHHAGDQRRLEFHHRLPRHRHDVGPALVRRGQQHDRPGFEQPVDLGEGEGAHGVRLGARRAWGQGYVIHVILVLFSIYHLSVDRDELDPFLREDVLFDIRYALGQT